MNNQTSGASNWESSRVHSSGPHFLSRMDQRRDVNEDRVRVSHSRLAAEENDSPNKPRQKHRLIQDIINYLNILHLQI